jgi:signal transduction histidine kinase
MTSTSATLDSVPTPVASQPPALYWRLWKGVPRELAYLLIAFPISVAGFAVTVSLISGGAGTIVTFFIGLVLIIAALYVARGFGTLELMLLEWARRPRIARPEWMDARARKGFLGWLRAVVGNGHYWLYLLYVMVVDFIITTITWSIAVTWAAGSLGGITYWFWDAFIPHGSRDFSVGAWVFERFGIDVSNSMATDNVFFLIVGIIMLATLPFVTRGLTSLHWLVARGILGAWKSDALKREVQTLSESRGAAISAEGHSLRRLERDIHDGPQQRLVRLQMDLSAAQRKLDDDPQGARDLIDGAMTQSKEALEELRALSQGFAPPILLDRGLVAALESLVARSNVTVGFTNLVDPGVDLPQELARNAYFIASELLTNVAKHSRATEVGLTVELRRVPETDATWLDVTVTDNGRGGATTVPGHGLAGLEERVRGLGGVLVVSSPTGGPTSATANLPVTLG